MAIFDMFFSFYFEKKCNNLIVILFFLPNFLIQFTPRLFMLKILKFKGKNFHFLI